jgi:hypothetical protein
MTANDPSGDSRAPREYDVRLYEILVEELRSLHGVWIDNFRVILTFNSLLLPASFALSILINRGEIAPDKHSILLIAGCSVVHRSSRNTSGYHDHSPNQDHDESQAAAGQTTRVENCQQNVGGPVSRRLCSLRWESPRHRPRGHPARLCSGQAHAAQRSQLLCRLRCHGRCLHSSIWIAVRAQHSWNAAVNMNI